MDLFSFLEKSPIEYESALKLWDVYSPNDLITNRDILDSLISLSKMTQQLCIPVLLIGSTGIGKTLCAHLWFETLVKEKLQEFQNHPFYHNIQSKEILIQKIKENHFREVNASNSRTALSLQESLGPFLNKDLGHSDIIPKFILLDEVGSNDSPFPKDAQYWLLSILKNRQNVQIILTSNGFDPIPELKSRLKISSFKQMGVEDAIRPLKSFQSNFKIQFTSILPTTLTDPSLILEQWAKELVYFCHGDVRSFLSASKQLIEIAKSKQKSNDFTMIEKSDLDILIKTSAYISLDEISKLFHLIENVLIKQKTFQDLFLFLQGFASKGDPSILVHSILNYYATQDVDLKSKIILDQIYSNCLDLRTIMKKENVEYFQVIAAIFNPFCK